MHFGRHDFRSFQLQLHVVLFWWFWKDEKEKEEKVGDGDPGEVGFESILWTKSFFSRSFSRLRVQKLISEISEQTKTVWLAVACGARALAAS